jgi:hypothetical protein
LEAYKAYLGSCVYIFRSYDSAASYDRYTKRDPASSIGQLDARVCAKLASDCRKQNVECAQQSCFRDAAGQVIAVGHDGWVQYEDGRTLLLHDFLGPG